MNPVLAHPAAAGEDQVAGAGRLLGPGLARDLRGQQPQARPRTPGICPGSCRIKVEGAADGGDAALVAAVLDPFDDPVQQPPGVQPGF